MRHYIGYLCILMAAFCWGLTGPIARFALSDAITPLEVAFWRSAFGCLFFVLHATLRHSFKLRGVKDFFSFAVFGAIALGGFFASYQYAIQAGGAALAAVLLYTAPAWVAVSSRVFFGEKLSKAKLTAICLALTGVFCISISGYGNGATASVSSVEAENTLHPAGIFFGLLAGFLYSTHYIFAAKFLQRYTTHTLYGYLMFFGSIALLPFIQFMPKSPSSWLVLLTLGFVCTYSAYWFYCEGLKRLAPTKAAILATFEPLIAIFAAWWIWGERFAVLGWAGSALVIGAVICLVLEPGREKQLQGS